MLLVELVAVGVVTIIVIAVASFVWTSNVGDNQKNKKEKKKDPYKVDGTKMQYGEQGNSKNLEYVRGR